MSLSRRRGGGSGSGTSGADGKTIITTSGVPSSGVGVNGDYAIDPTAKVFYGPKSGGVWPAGFSLVGPAGANGSGGSVDLSNYPTLDQVATVEDLAYSVRVETTQAATGFTVVPCAMVPATITAAEVISETANIGTSNSAYWSFTVEVYRESEYAGSIPAPHIVATKTTQVGSEALLPLLSWTFDTVTFDTAAAALSPRDVVIFRWTKVGSPASLARMTYCIRAEPVR